MRKEQDIQRKTHVEQFEDLLTNSKYRPKLEAKRLDDRSLLEILSDFTTPEQQVSIMILINNREMPWKRKGKGDTLRYPTRVIEGRKLSDHNETVEKVLGDWKLVEKLVKEVTSIIYAGRIGNLGGYGDLTLHEQDPELLYGHN